MIVKGRDRATGRPVVIVGVEEKDILNIADTFAKHGYDVGWDFTRRELHISLGPMSGDFVPEGEFVVLSGHKYLRYDSLDTVLSIYTKRQPPKRAIETGAKTVDTMLSPSDFYHLIDIVRALRSAESTNEILEYRFCYGAPDGTEREAKLIF